MELKKCKRCGAFFVSGEYVCPNCAPKDSAEIYKLKDYLTENDYSGSLENLAFNTGISVKNLTRYIGQEDFSEFVAKFGNEKAENINYEL